MMSGHVWSFPDCGGSCGLCPGSGSRRGRTLPSGVYPAGELRWHFPCCFDFVRGLWLRFVKLWVIFNLWRVLWAVSEVENSAHLPASSSEVYPAGKLQWHFTCGFDFRHSLWLPFVTFFAVLKGLTRLVFERDFFHHRET